MTSIATKDTTPRFVYWGLNARAQLPMLLLRAGNIEYIWDMTTANTWPEPKKTVPFGQLPVLYHNNLVIPQSGSISRYCARLANLMPSDENNRIMADMLMEQSNDIYTMLIKAKYAGDDEAQYNAWKELRENNLHTKLEPLVTLVGNKTYFSGNNYHAGDIAVFSALWLVIQANLEQELGKYPTLMNHYKQILNLGEIQSFVDEGAKAYFIAPPMRTSENVEATV